MAKPAVKSFSATLERMRSRLNWVIVRIPFDVKKTWGSAAMVKVRGDINGFEFRTSLFPQRDGSHILLVNKKMQRGGRCSEGSLARFHLGLDTEERVVVLPAEFKRYLAESRDLERWFEKLNYSTRYTISRWIAEVISSDARRRRAEQIAERLYETMEAERELPPLIQHALNRDPRARKGWDLMSPSRQRGLLLAIFYYRTPDSRARRLEKVVEEAIARAENDR
jgi:uncharacterized protein YdeI (YjbR/CyaY-like superfamily)